MIKTLLYILVGNTLALLVSDKALDGLSFEGGYAAYVAAALIIILLNIFIKPIIKLLSFPLIFFSAGIFLIVINAFILYLTKYTLSVIDIYGITMTVENYLTYVLAAIIFGLTNWFISWLIKE